MKLSQLDSLLRAVWDRRDSRPMCATCDKPVARMSEPMTHQDYKVRLLFECHGKREEVDFDPDSSAPLEKWPRRLFLRNWAGYTIRPRRSEGRRL